MLIEINDEMLTEVIKKEMLSIYEDCTRHLENLQNDKGSVAGAFPWFSTEYSEEFQQVSEIQEAARIMHNYHSIPGKEEI